MSHSYSSAHPAYPAEPSAPPTAAMGPVGPAAHPPPSGPKIVINHPWDFVRSIAAGLFIVASLRLPWSPADDADEVVHVLATALIALFSLAVLPLARVLRTVDGSPVAWPTFPIRAAMCAPYVVVVVVSVVRDLVDAGPPLGAAVHVGIFGVVLAALPRDTEIATIRNNGVIVDRVRQACGASGALAAAALLITALVSMPPSRWFGTDGIFLDAVLPVLALLGLVCYLFVATAVFIGLGHVSWQPILLWLGAPLVLVLGESGIEESIRGGFYGIWLLVLSVALASVPLVGGKDGTKNEARFWVTVVTNAFRLLLIGNVAVLVLIMVVFIQAAQRAGGAPGELIWLLMSAVATVAGLWFASTRFRADPGPGRNVALVAVIALSGLRLIDIAVAPVNANAATGLAASFSLTVVVYWVILYALTVPRVVRATYRARWVGPNTTAAVVAPDPGYPEARSLPPAVSPGPGDGRAAGGPPADPGSTGSATGGAPSSGARPTPDGPIWPTGPTGPTPDGPIWPTGPNGPNGPTGATGPNEGASVGRLEAKPVGLDTTAVIPPAAAMSSEPGRPGAWSHPSPPDQRDESPTQWPRPTPARPTPAPSEPVAPVYQPPAPGYQPPAPGYQPPDLAALAAADPATSGQELRSIAAARPDLCPVIAANPATYPDLLAWLGNLGDPAVDAALAGRPRKSGWRRR